MSRSFVAHSDTALQNLRTLLEVNTQMARDPHVTSGQASDDVRSALVSARRAASAHRDELAQVIREWEEKARGGAPEEPERPETALSTRELVESWVAIKESAAEIYRRCAAEAPSSRIRRRLLDLAHEESIHAERLRSLL